MCKCKCSTFKRNVRVKLHKIVIKKKNKKCVITFYYILLVKDFFHLILFEFFQFIVYFIILPTNKFIYFESSEKLREISSDNKTIC